MNRFYIIANSDKDKEFRLAKELCDYIKKKGGECVYQQFDPQKDGGIYNLADTNKIPVETQCVIVLGGDGTLIQAARDLSSIEAPVFGINIGTLGYLTEIDREQAFPSIDLLLSDQYVIDERMILRGEVYRGNERIYSDIALNDIVLNRIGPLRMIHFDVYVNNEFLITYPADGLVVSTPTGSTAYNLSAGGPIVRPETKAIVMTPVCPHILNKSSVIFGSDDILEIHMCKSGNGTEERVVTFDGDHYVPLVSGDKIIISKSEHKARLVRTKKHNFLQILRNKLS